MTWMVIRLILSLAFIGLVLWFAARVAKKRGLGGTGNGLIEVVARQRMGRSSTVNVVRVGDVVLVVGATEEQVTLLAEIDQEALEAAAGEREELRAVRLPARSADGEDQPADDATPTVGPRRHAAPGRSSSSGALAGSVFDRNGWGSFVNQVRERTVRRP